MIQVLAEAAAVLFVANCLGLVVAGALRRSGIGRGRKMDLWLKTYIEYVSGSPAG